MDISDAEFEDEFSIFGISVNNPDVFDKLRQLCHFHQLNAENIVCEWLAYCKSKKIPLQMSVEFLEQFERERLNKNGSKPSARSDLTSPSVFSSQTVDRITSYDDGDDDDDLVNKYCTPKSGLKKRRLIDHESNKRITQLAQSPGLPFSPRSLMSPASAPSEKYRSRSNAGEVVTKFGMTDGIVWSRSQRRKLVISNYDSKLNFKDCKYMFEKLCEKAHILSSQMEEMADNFKNHGLIEDVSHVSMQHQGTATIVGRIACDGNGRLNSSSVILQGSKETSFGRWVPLDLSAVTQYSLFPGQLVALEGTNTTGTKFVVSKVLEGIELPLPTKPTLTQGELTIVVACGPFTVSDNDLYEPLDDLLNYLDTNPPDVCILLGPFVDAKMADSERMESLEVSYEDIFYSKMGHIINMIQRLGITLAVFPSQRDIHHDWVYPQPPFIFPKAGELKDIYFLPDPCTVVVDGVVIGATSTDILFHMGAEEISSCSTADRFSRLANHILTQHSYYPLLPAGLDVNLDVELNDLYGQLPVTPHILVLPSDLRYFVKSVGKSVCINPGRLAKGQVGGTFARIVVNRPEADGLISSSVAAEIIRV